MREREKGTRAGEKKAAVMRGIENVFLSMRESGEKAGDARSYYENVFEKVRERN